MNKTYKLSDSDLTILRFLWESNEYMTANEIWTAIKVETDWKEPTVRTLLNRMTDKMILSRYKRGVYFYAPLIQKEEYVRRQTDQLTELLGKKKLSLVTAFLDSEDLSQEEFQEILDYWEKRKSDKDAGR